MMRRVELTDGASLDEWLVQARLLLAEGVPPDQVQWQAEPQHGFLSAGQDSAARPTTAPIVGREPRDFLLRAALAIAYSDPRRHSLLYRILWRLHHGERALMRDATDDDVAWALGAAKAVWREKRWMKTSVRFRGVMAADVPVFVAWFESQHDVLPMVAPFFVRRFTGMRWSIITPRRSAHWDGASLVLGAGAQLADGAGEDGLEDLWRTNFANIFEPARLKASAIVDAMVHAAPTIRLKAFPAPARPGPAVLPHGSLDALRSEASACRACPLWAPATQMVFGVGPADARVMVIGEQPGDQEDLAGRPFVGPSGQLFDRALEAVGIAREALYVTNAVKHFKFVQRGSRRLHSNADVAEQAACRPWLMEEIARVRPSLILCLGAMASRALLGPTFRLLEQRGRWHELGSGIQVMPTVHPSWLLRQLAADRESAWTDWLRDLRQLRDAIEALHSESMGSAEN
jgi:probable DNA metabolism protein